MEIVILVLLFLLNGLFSMSEIAVVSARKARLQQLANEGNRGAGSALALAREPSNFLSTIQVGITFVGIFSGAFGGATLADKLARVLSTVPALAPHSDALALGIVVIAIAYFSLIIGELVPKRLALHNPERVASMTAVPMRLLSRFALPIVVLLSGSTELVLRAIGAGKFRRSPVSEDEIRLLMEQGTRAGVFAQVEQRLVHNVLMLDERPVAAEMTPAFTLPGMPRRRGKRRRRHPCQGYPRAAGCGKDCRSCCVYARAAVCAGNPQLYPHAGDVQDLAIADRLRGR
jgi:putative hemolysin